eukprot:Skav214286  [mRNA]  locus=scaffold2257:175493:178211:+ [translate_table: standard]
MRRPPGELSTVVEELEETTEKTPWNASDRIQRLSATSETQRTTRGTKTSKTEASLGDRVFDEVARHLLPESSAGRSAAAVGARRRATRGAPETSKAANSKGRALGGAQL